MSEVKEHSVIYLSPSDDPEREWCQDDVWEESVRYNLGADFDRVTAERDALQALLTAADERADVLEGLLRDSKDVMSGIWDTSYDHEAGDVLAALDLMERIDAALKPAEGRNEPNCLRCLDKKTVPSNLAEGYVMDCPGCCGEEG